MQERGEKSKFILDDIPNSLPSLSKALKLQKEAAKVGFDWDDVNDIWLKLEEEIGEVKEAIKEQNKTEIEQELGDMLFVLVNLSRYYKVNPEVALNRTNQKFTSRFQYIERKLDEQHKNIKKAALETMDYYWTQAKGEE